VSRYDDLSPRALWFLQNFDELTLAEMCAANKAASQATAERVRHVADLIENGAPWAASRADTAARVRGAAGPQENPPGDRREQIPAEVLALLSPRSYLSTACDTARRVDAATIRYPERADLPAWVERLHARCRLTHKFTGTACYCRCHAA